MSSINDSHTGKVSQNQISSAKDQNTPNEPESLFKVSQFVNVNLPENSSH